MELAATFRNAFPCALLLEVAQAEGLSDVNAMLSYLQKQRLLQQGDGGTRLWMSPPLQAYIHARQSRAQRIRRHRRALLYYRRHGSPLEVAWHLQMAELPAEAATLLLEAAPQLIGELQAPDLGEALAEFTSQQLPPPLWFQVQRCLCDVQRQLGESESQPSLRVVRRSKPRRVM